MTLTKATYSMISGSPANVLDYGADPTGATDSSEAFLAAMQASSKVYVPEGVYQVSIDIPQTITYGPKKLFGTGTSGTTASGTILIPPPDAPYVIRIDSSSGYMQYFQLENLNISNPNAVTSCIGILFNGTDVFSISDYHTITNVNISGFVYGVQVSGRLIQSTWSQVYIGGCATAFYAVPDASNAAFILNTFINCAFNDCTNQGIYIGGWSLTNKFTGCNFQGNNQANTAGVAATHFTNAQNMSFDNCYWEGNGGGVAVDTADPLNNSISCLFDGDNFTSAPCITNSWMVGSGAGLVITGAVLLGGEITNTAVSPSAGGWTVAILSSINQGDKHPQFKSHAGGKVFFGPDGGGQWAAYSPQQPGWYWGAPTSLDLTSGFSNFMVDARSGTVNFVAPTNAFSGAEISIFAYGGSVVFPAASMFNGSSVTITSGTMKTFIALGYPYNEKFAVKS